MIRVARRPRARSAWRIATLRITITRSPSALRVEVADDGRGIDTEGLVRRAVDSGLIDAGASTTMSESEKLRLVLAPGLSTAESVSDISGRGVGAGAVRNAVEAVGGILDVQSERGRGTTFVLELPISESARCSDDAARSARLPRSSERARYRSTR